MHASSDPGACLSRRPVHPGTGTLFLTSDEEHGALAARILAFIGYLAHRRLPGWTSGVASMGVWTRLQLFEVEGVHRETLDQRSPAIPAVS
jgi:hypothetical protein